MAIYEITRTLPKELKWQLPQPEEIAAWLGALMKIYPQMPQRGADSKPDQKSV